MENQTQIRTTRPSISATVLARLSAHSDQNTLDMFSPDRVKIAQQYEAAFEAWKSMRSEDRPHVPGTPRKTTRKMSEDSIDVYQHMFTPFAAYCTGQAIPLEDLTAEDIKTYLEVSDIKPATEGAGDRRRRPMDFALSRYGFRLVSLLKQVLDQAVASGVLQRRNTAAAEVLRQNGDKEVNARPDGSDLDILRADQAARLVRLCRLPISSDPHAPHDWRDVRNNTAALVQLGGGLTPGEVCSITLSDVRIADDRVFLYVAGNAKVSARETPLSPSAKRQLQYWLRLRRSVGLRSEMLFPSDQDRRWSKYQIYRAMQAVLGNAGLTEAGGSYRLRHTFILRQLKANDPKKPHEVAAWVGIRDVERMVERYRAILLDPGVVVV